MQHFVTIRQENIALKWKFPAFRQVAAATLENSNIYYF